ncbi:hypothetical protein ABZ639_27365 [Saccharomonospora sp. NPDC006951]
MDQRGSSQGGGKSSYRVVLGLSDNAARGHAGHAQQATELSDTT